MSDPSAVPTDPFAAYVPSAQEPWDTRRVGHLLRRAGLGANPVLVEAMLKQSPAQAVDSLLNYDVSQDPFNDLVDRMEGFFSLDKIETVQGWWFYRMLNTPRPSQERVALFWHNRFATSAGKVDNPRFMHNQIEMFRQKGLGNYRDLLVSVTHDPAMLIWLDGQSNRRGKPNENYAREVMELFTLGIGNYTEQDVKELARAFTGWQINGQQPAFNAKQWDDGEKEVFGVKDHFNSESAIDLILKQPAAPKYLATKILHEFVHPSPTDEMVAHWAERAVALQWELKPLFREVFTSNMFFSDWAYRSRIKSPVELVVGGAVTLGGKVNTDFLAKSTAKMGQNLLYPPNVKGWDGNEAWINSNTVLLRFNYGLYLCDENRQEYARRPELEAWLTQHNIKTADGAVDYYTGLLVDGQIEPEVRTKLIDYLNHGNDGKVKAFALSHDSFNAKVRPVLHLVMAMPEYQLA